MNKIVYWLTIAVIYPLSYLPLAVLYLLSNVLFAILYYILKYRRKVVYTNMRNSFPEWSESKLRATEKAFYKHLSDLFIESIKLFTMSATELDNRVNYLCKDLLNELYKNNQSVLIATGHCANWEMVGIGASCLHQNTSVTLYQPIKNKSFDDLIKRSRGRFGLKLIAKNNSRELISMIEGESKLFYFLSDQAPSAAASKFWTMFLNQETAVYLGLENMARLTGVPVYHVQMVKTKRGHYEVDLHEVSLNPKDTAPGEITAKFTQMLEQDIKNQPETWLWSHKRWKRSKPEGVPLNTVLKTEE